MSGTVWIPQAEQLHPVGASGDMLGGPPRVVWHTTEAPSGKTSAGRDYFDLMDRVLTGKSAEPHILWDPVTDRLGQYFPLNRSARALRNDDVSGQRTNRTGVVCIQIEVVGYAHKPFTSYWKPGPNFAALMAAIRSWGIPDVWPSGRMSQAGESVSRDLTTWRTKAGHYGHCHVPGNSHWDCGAIDQQLLLSTGRGAAAPDPSEEDDMPHFMYTAALNDQAQGGTGEMGMFAPGVWVPIQSTSHLKAYRAHGLVGPDQLNLAPNWYQHYKTMHTQQMQAAGVDTEALLKQLAALVPAEDAARTAAAVADELDRRQRERLGTTA